MERTKRAALMLAALILLVMLPGGSRGEAPGGEEFDAEFRREFCALFYEIMAGELGIETIIGAQASTNVGL